MCTMHVLTMSWNQFWRNIHLPLHKIFDESFRNTERDFSVVFERLKSCSTKFSSCRSKTLTNKTKKHLYYKGRCVSVCGHSNVQTLTSPPVLKLWDTQGYLWLPYDLTKVIKLIGVTYKQKITLCHSFRISVIPSVLLSFLPDYCHSFRISVILSKYCHSLWII